LSTFKPFHRRRAERERKERAQRQGRPLFVEQGFPKEYWDAVRNYIYYAVGSDKDFIAGVCSLLHLPKRVSHFYEIEELIYKDEAKWISVQELFLYGFSDQIEFSVHQAVLNDLAREYGVGFQFNDHSEAVPISSEVAYKEITEPALVVLSDPEFEISDKALRDGYQDYRNRDYSGAIREACTALDHALRTILNIDRDKKMKAPDLVKKLRAAQLIEAYQETYAEHIYTLLQKGLPALRGPLSDAHQKKTGEELRAYARLALHEATVWILFLHDRWTAKKNKGQSSRHSLASKEKS
jgi:hypothetical protein